MGVRNEDTTVACSLHGTENPRSRSRAFQTNIKITFEWPRSIVPIHNFRKLQGTIRLSDAFVLVRKTEFCQGSSCDEQASGVGCKGN
jgi:hypothetical protein